jgi:hypothetical protein
MNPKNAGPDYTGDQPQDAGPAQDETLEKRRNRPFRLKVGQSRVTMDSLGEGGRPMRDPARSSSQCEDPQALTDGLPGAPENVSARGTT